MEREQERSARAASRASAPYIENAAASPGGTLRSSLHPGSLPPPRDHLGRATLAEISERELSLEQVGAIGGKGGWRRRSSERESSPERAGGIRRRLGRIVRALSAGFATGLGGFDAVESSSCVDVDGQLQSCCAGRGCKWAERWPPRVEQKYDCRFTVFVVEDMLGRRDVRAERTLIASDAVRDSDDSL